MRRPVILLARVAAELAADDVAAVDAAADRRKGDRLVGNERVRLQAVLQRRQIGHRLHRRAGLTLRLRGAIELAQGVGEASRHGEDTAGLVLQHQSRTLAVRPHPQLRLRGGSRGGILLVSAVPRGGTVSWLDDVDIDDIVEAEVASDRGRPCRQRHDAAVGQSDTDRAVAAFAAFLQHHSRCPMHVVERQVDGLERLLPRRERGLVVDFKFLHGVGDIRLWAAELGPPG